MTPRRFKALLRIAARHWITGPLMPIAETLEALTDDQSAKLKGDEFVTSPVHLGAIVVTQAIRNLHEKTARPELKFHSACVLVMHPGRHDLVLGVSRKHDHDDWGLPGGKLEPGERPYTAASRETLEETGTIVMLSSQPLCFEAETPWSDKIAICYLAQKMIGEPHRPSSEEGLVAWVTWEQLFAGSYGWYNRIVHRAYLQGLDP